MVRAAAFVALSTLLTLAGCAASPSESEATVDDDLREVAVNPAGPAELPAFDDLWANYLNGELAEVKREVGGAVDAAWITNTCAIRMSNALNESGSLVPKGSDQFPFPFNTVTGRNRAKNYMFRVAELRSYLTYTFGKPTLTASAERGTAGVDPAPFANKRGVLVFDIKVWPDVTGHVDIWNGVEARHEAYFPVASTVQLWETK